MRRRGRLSLWYLDDHCCRRVVVVVVVVVGFVVVVVVFVVYDSPLKTLPQSLMIVKNKTGYTAFSGIL